MRDMNSLIGRGENSFLNQSAEGQRILVIVPHEDDEINLAGSIMRDYVMKGAEVYCAFTTNGDYSFAAETRMREAKHSLSVLGVDHVFFLGYGDTANHYKGGHLFYSEEKVVKSPSKHTETYGSAEAEDYVYQRSGQHSPYCRKSMRRDLKDLILSVQADIIFCVDLDVHADHRAASIIFEEAMEEILRMPGNVYFPTVMKGFAYCTSFGAPKDFYAINIYSVPKPGKRTDILIDKSIYRWSDRVRFPVVPDCRGHFLRHNILYQALFQHASQSAALHAVRIANGDAVFWERRTDNLVFQANVTASSGDPQKAVSFKILDLDNIDDTEIVPESYIWKPDSSDTDRSLYFRWTQARRIESLSVCGQVTGEETIKKMILYLPNGKQYELGPLPGCGNILKFNLPEPCYVTECRLQISEADGDLYGISAVGFFEHVHKEDSIKPYIKIMIKDDFAYDYLLPKTEKDCRLSIYRYHVLGKIRYRILNELAGHVDEDGHVFFSPQADKIHIRAEIINCPEIYDEICLYRISPFSFYKLHVQQWLENKGLTFYLKKYRKYTHIRHKYLKKL